VTISDSHGGASASLAYTPALPKGVEVKEALAPTTRVGGQEKSYSLDVENIDPVPEDEFMPPMRSVSYRVLFYYTNIRTTQEYWKSEGKYWSHEIDGFMSSNKLGGVVAGIVAPSDTPTQKAQKIYKAVMTLENTSFTRGHSRAEDKAQGVKIKTAEDIWTVKRGNANEIALLYVALARAAGLQAYAAQVTNRDEAFFVPIFLSTDQLDDELAIVILDGKEQFLDPGNRYCAFGDLHWKHTMTGGLRQTDHGAELLLQTPSPGYKTTTLLRTADLNLDPDGKLNGSLRLTMTGNQALYWRQRALATDEDAVKKEFEQSVQSTLPPGVEVKTDHWIGLTDYDKNLMATMAVSGSMGTATSKRVFIPTIFFEAGSKPLFVHEKRTVPIDLHYPYGAQDTVVIHLPATWTVESAPKDAQIPLPKNALYQTTIKQTPGKLEIGRVFILANSLYLVNEYGDLKDFYQKVNARDQEQAVLQPAIATTAQSGGIK
jgi:Transglutaminase-like superfamily